MSKEEKTKKPTSDEDTDSDDTTETAIYLFGEGNWAAVRVYGSVDSTTDTLADEMPNVIPVEDPNVMGNVSLGGNFIVGDISGTDVGNFSETIHEVIRDDKSNPSSVLPKDESSWEVIVKERLSRLENEQKTRLDDSEQETRVKDSYFLHKLSISAFLVATGAFLGGTALALAGAGTVLIVKIIMDEDSLS